MVGCQNQGTGDVAGTDCGLVGVAGIAWSGRRDRYEHSLSYLYEVAVHKVIAGKSCVLVHVCARSLRLQLLYSLMMRMSCYCVCQGTNQLARDVSFLFWHCLPAKRCARISLSLACRWQVWCSVGARSAADVSRCVVDASAETPAACLLRVACPDGRGAHFGAVWGGGVGKRGSPSGRGSTVLRSYH